MSSENALQKQAMQHDQGLANAPLKKKIGFFSAMMVVVGSCIGAGIFFKAGSVLDNSANSIVFAIFAWLLASFAVIAMGLALVEIASARNDNLSMIGWSQTFNSRFIYKACKNFMVYIYLPLTYFFMPLYVVMSIQDGIEGITGTAAFGTSADWAIMMVIAVVMSIYFIVVCGFSSKAGNIQNWIITVFKFIPLVLAVVFGIWAFIGNSGAIKGNYDWTFPGNMTTAAITDFASMTPGFGLFIAVAAIFFAYDGFYVASGIQTEMKEPKKTPLAILFGLIIVTVIYLLIAIAMSLGSDDGSPMGFKDFLTPKGLGWLYGTFQILIGVGVLGIINGFALWSTRFMEDLILANEVPYSTKLASKINPKYPVIGILYNLVLALPIVVVFCIIGGLGYVDSVGYGEGYGTGVAKLYSFADLMGTWTALLAFAFIAFAIAGGLKNRKTNLVKTQKNKYFVPMGWISVIIIMIAIFFTFFEPIANLFLLFRMHENNAITDQTTHIISKVMLVVVLFIFLALMILPIIIEDAVNKKKYGSLDKAELENAKMMGAIKGNSLEKEVIENLAIQKRIVLHNWEKDALGRDYLTEEELYYIYGDIEDNTTAEATPVVARQVTSKPSVTKLEPKVSYIKSQVVKTTVTTPSNAEPKITRKVTSTTTVKSNNSSSKPKTVSTTKVTTKSKK